jgi:hypothetical protein
MRYRFLAAILSALCASPVLAQTPCFDLNVGTDLQLGDDDTAQGLSLGFTFNFAGVPYTQICVCSNGYIWLGPTSVGGGDYTPTEAELLAGAPRICPLWIDFQANAPGSGHIYYSTVAASGSTPAYAMITWAGVTEFGTTHALSMQVKLDANNAVNVIYGADTVLATGGTAGNGTTIIGASPGNGAASHIVSLATRPALISSNTFAEVQSLPGFAYAGISMNWQSLSPTAGYVISDTPCTPNSFPAPAAYSRIGNGCPPLVSVSVYELFDGSNPMDLSNLSYAFFPNGLGAGDDTTAAVSLPFPFPYDGGVLNSIVVSSNGFVWLDPTNFSADCCSGYVAGFLSSSPRIAGMWTDLNANAAFGAGAVYADLDANTGEFVITWSGIAEYGYGGSNTFQIALDAAGGFQIRYQTVGLAAGSGHTVIAGFSGGNQATDSPVDLSATPVYDTGATSTPLDMSPTGNPVPQLGTTFVLTTSGIPSTSPLGITIIGNHASNPPLDLTSLGAPGCLGYVEVFSGFAVPFFQVTGGSSSVSLSLAIPNTVSLAGVTLYAQGAALSAINSLGLIFSNGGQLVVGT